MALGFFFSFRSQNAQLSIRKSPNKTWHVTVKPFTVLSIAKTRIVSKVHNANVEHDLRPPAAVVLLLESRFVPRHRLELGAFFVGIFASFFFGVEDLTAVMVWLGSELIMF